MDKMTLDRIRMIEGKLDGLQHLCWDLDLDIDETEEKIDDVDKRIDRLIEHLNIVGVGFLFKVITRVKHFFNV